MLFCGCFIFVDVSCTIGVGITVGGGCRRGGSKTHGFLTVGGAGLKISPLLGSIIGTEPAHPCRGGSKTQVEAFRIANAHGRLSTPFFAKNAILRVLS